MLIGNIEIKINQYRIAGVELSNITEIQQRLREDLREEVPLNLISIAVNVVCNTLRG